MVFPPPPRIFFITVKKVAAGFSETSVSNDFRLWYVTRCRVVEVYGSFRRCLLIAVSYRQVIDGRHSHSSLHAVICQYRAVFFVTAIRTSGLTFWAHISVTTLHFSKPLPCELEILHG